MSKVSVLFNYFFAVFALGFGQVLEAGATVVIAPCTISPYLDFASKFLLTFLFPVILVFVRWKLKDRNTQKLQDRKVRQILGEEQI